MTKEINGLTYELIKDENSDGDVLTIRIRSEAHTILEETFHAEDWIFFCENITEIIKEWKSTDE